MLEPKIEYSKGPNGETFMEVSVDKVNVNVTDDMMKQFNDNYKKICKEAEKDAQIQLLSKQAKEILKLQNTVRSMEGSTKAIKEQFRKDYATMEGSTKAVKEQFIRDYAKVVNAYEDLKKATTLPYGQDPTVIISELKNASRTIAELESIRETLITKINDQASYHDELFQEKDAIIKNLEQEAKCRADVPELLKENAALKGKVLAQKALLYDQKKINTELLIEAKGYKLAIGIIKEIGGV